MNKRTIALIIQFGLPFSCYSMKEDQEASYRRLYSDRDCAIFDRGTVYRDDKNKVALTEVFPIIDPESPHFNALNIALIKIGSMVKMVQAGQTSQAYMASLGMVQAWQKNYSAEQWSTVARNWRTTVVDYCIKAHPDLFAKNQDGSLCYEGGRAFYSLNNITDDAIAYEIGVYCYKNEKIPKQFLLEVTDRDYHDELKNLLVRCGVNIQNLSTSELMYRAAHRKFGVEFDNTIAFCKAAAAIRTLRNSEGSSHNKGVVDNLWADASRALRLGAYASIIMEYPNVLREKSGAAAD